MRLPGLETVNHTHTELSSEDTVGRLWSNDGFLIAHDIRTRKWEG